MALNVVTIAGSMTVDYGVIYFVDATNGALNLTLPVTTGNAGNVVRFHRIDWVSANSVTIIPNPADGSFIDQNATSLVLSPVHLIELTVDVTNSWIQLRPDTFTSGVFGDGSDGNLTVNSNQTLSSDMNFLSLTVGNGAIINTNGYRVMVADRLTLQGTGTLIHNNGTAAVNGTAGAGGAGNSIGGGFAGAAGVTAGIGTAGTQGNPTTATPGSVGGAGGAGGAAGGNAGGAGGVNTRPTVAAGGANCIRKWQHAIIARDHNSAMLIGGSSGGSGGCALGASGTSGGGGGSGGIVMITARNVVCTAAQSVTISATGGAGGAATGTGNAGGGGGGGGGCLILVTRTPNAQNSLPGLSLTVAGGAAGAGVGTGSSGTAGTNGIIRIIDSV